MAALTLHRRNLVRGILGAGAVAAGTFGGSPHGPPRLRAQASGTEAVTSPHYLATNAGMDILAAGGSAADASVAVAAVISVVEPWFSHVLGGGSWIQYYDASTGGVTAVDAVGPIGSNATIENYGSRIDASGIHQSILPGAWDGWMVWLMEYGRLELPDILQRSINLARNGFPVSTEMASWSSSHSEEIFANAGATAVYAPNGYILSAGETAYQHELASTLEAIVAEYLAVRGTGLREDALQAARDYVYRGPIADAVVQESDAYGGYLTIDDFTNFSAVIEEPLSIPYRDGIQVYEAPPNRQGITMLMALNILKGMGLGDYVIDDPIATHLQIEAMKLALRDRNAYVGDPDYVDVPVETLLSDDYAAQQRARITTDSVLEWPFDSGVVRRDVPGHTHTFQVVDRDGNGASVTTSVGLSFTFAGTTGISMNTRMTFLSLYSESPNVLRPGGKVRHTSCPYLVTKGGELLMLGGNTGADIQTQAQTQKLISVIEYGLDAQAALDRPRWITRAVPNGSYPWDATNALLIQQQYSETLAGELAAIGHGVTRSSSSFGTAGLLILNGAEGTIDAGAEPSTSVASAEVR